MLCIHICMYISEVGRIEVVTRWLYRKNWAVECEVYQDTIRAATWFMYWKPVMRR
jgi:hypothetical protein